jgi:hypothetical protein
MEPLKLYLVHCGFYDTELLDGVYESHVNFIVAGESFEDARAKVKQEPDFQKKRMHVDGLQQIDAVSGCRISLSPDPGIEGKTILTSSRHRDLAPKTTPN